MTAIANGKGVPFACETFRFHLRVRSLMVLPPYKGAVFHGAFDNAMRRLVCPLPRRACINCELKTKCHYITICNPSPPADFKDRGKFPSAPPPYVLTPPPDNKQCFKTGNTLTFELTLIGRALDALPYTIFSFIQIGCRGLGRERGRFDIEQVELLRNGKTLTIYDGASQTLKMVPPGPSDPARSHPSRVQTLTLTLNTPLRLKQKGHLVTRLDFATFFDALSRRLALLSALYGDNGQPTVLARLPEHAAAIQTAEDKTFWYDWSRYSTRQKEPMKLGGLRGSITFAGNLTPFMPWLRLGEVVHVGQGATFGLGAILTSAG